MPDPKNSDSTNSHSQNQEINLILPEFDFDEFQAIINIDLQAEIEKHIKPIDLNLIMQEASKKLEEYESSEIHSIAEQIKFKPMFDLNKPMFDSKDIIIDPSMNPDLYKHFDPSQHESEEEDIKTESFSSRLLKDKNNQQDQEQER